MTLEIPWRLYKLKPHVVQYAYRDSTARFNVVPAGRRSGKTERAKRRLIKRALACRSPWRDPRFFAGAPTRDQAKRIFWNDLKAMIPRAMMRRRPRETDLCIELLTGVEIWVVGMDQPARIEGAPWDGGVLDEIGNTKPDAWPKNVRPALSDRKGWCDLIGVPEGRNHYYDLWKYAISGADPEWRGFTWHSADILDAAEIESAKRGLDPLVFEQEYEASFINFEGRAYYPFNEGEHAKPLRQLYDPRQPLIFCFDFNIAPGVAAVIQELALPGQYQRDRFGAPLLDQPIVGSAIIGEVYIDHNSNTPAVCRKLVADWGTHQGIVRCYGDQTGGQGGSAKVQGSDWKLIHDELKQAFPDRLTFRVKSGNPPERARVNAVNSRLKNRAREIRMMVDPAYARHVVVDFEGVRTLKGGSGEIDKKIDDKLTHLSDAIGYYVDFEFPVAGQTRVVKEFPF